MWTDSASADGRTAQLPSPCVHLLVPISLLLRSCSAMLCTCKASGIVILRAALTSSLQFFIIKTGSSQQVCMEPTPSGGFKHRHE